MHIIFENKQHVKTTSLRLGHFFWCRNDCLKLVAGSVFVTRESLESCMFFREPFEFRIRTDGASFAPTRPSNLEHCSGNRYRWIHRSGSLLGERQRSTKRFEAKADWSAGVDDPNSVFQRQPTLIRIGDNLEMQEIGAVLRCRHLSQPVHNVPSCSDGGASFAHQFCDLIVSPASNRNLSPLSYW